MEIILAVAVAVVGWLTTHYLSIKAQNKSFLNRVLNDARLEITKAIREHQDWLGQVYTKILFLNSLSEVGHPIDWKKETDRFTELFSRSRHTLTWAIRLEDYEILFPNTAECRKSLIARDIEINKYLGYILNELQARRVFTTEIRPKTCEDVMKEAKDNVQILLDQEHLAEDIRIYLQNICLSSITGNQIPERKPLDPSLPRLAPDQQGNLQIIEGQSTRKSKNEKPKRINVQGPFISRKTAIDWPQGGTTKERYEAWLHNLKDSLEENTDFSDWLRKALKEGGRLELKARIYGIPQRIKLLDIHDATAQIIDEVTECLFPKEKGKPTPQVQDRHFWKIEGEKFISSEERTEVEIEQF